MGADGRGHACSHPDSLLPARTSANVLQVEGERTGSSFDMEFLCRHRQDLFRPLALRQSRKVLSPARPHDDAKGVVVKDDDITFVQTPENVKKRRTTSITTGTQVNAGRYQLVLSGEGHRQNDV